MSCLENRAVKLYPHQKRVATYIMDNRGLLCIHSTGSGKSLTSIASSVCLLENGVVSTVVILTKKSAVTQFAAEAKRYSTELTNNLIVTTHNQFFRHDANLVDPAKTLLIVDEAHEFTKKENITTSRVVDFAAKCKRVLLLTATPIANTPSDLVTLTAIIKNVDVPDPAAIEEIFAKPSKFKAWFKGVVDVHLIDKDADPNYPKKKMHKVSLGMSETTQAEYAKQLKKPAPFYTNLRQLSLGFGDNCEKCDWLLKHIKAWIKKGEGKVVVYTAYIERGADMLRKLLIDNGVNVLVIDGATSMADRRGAALLFNKKPEEEVTHAAAQQDLRNLVETDQEKCGKDGVLVTRVSVAVELPPSDSGKKRKKYTFTYYQGKNTTGELAAAKDQEYAESLKIPPAWSPAKVCAPTSTKVLWMAQDAAGRWQHRYSEDWNVQQEYKKIVRLKALNSKFWTKFNKVLDADLSSSNDSMRATALAVRILKTCHIRVGSELDDIEDEDDEADDEAETAATATTAQTVVGGKDTPDTPASKDKRHFGLTTLLKKHIKRDGDTSKLSFIGKSGKKNKCTIEDAKVAKHLDWLLGMTSDRNDSIFGDKVTAPIVRKYLSAIKQGLRPKDFRTYFANYTLVDQLRQGQSAVELNPRQRTRRLNEAIKVAAAGLNNTPTVAKKSYIFTGLSVLYLVDPIRFQAVIAGKPKGTTEDLLDDFIHLFDKNTIDWRYMLKWFKETKGLAQFMGPAQVLLITDAGSESIDLAGTRHVVFMDPTWTPALEDQIIGRGQRFASHAHLTEDQRTVNVWKLFLTSSGKADGTIEDGVDGYVSNLAAEKRAEQKKIYEKLAKL